MDCCFVNECERYAVTPVLVSPQVKCCESAPLYVPCCNDKVVYCCEKIRPCTPVARKICYDGGCDHSCGLCCEPKICPTCRQLTCPAKPAVKYVMPCYRYEDGRIEQFDSNIHGKLPATAYKRNGIQDQVNGYRGARRDLCAVEHDGKYYVYTAIEPFRKFYSRISNEKDPVRLSPKKINQPTCLTKHACKVACSYCPTQRLPAMPVQCIPVEPRKPTCVSRCCRVPDNCCTACLGIEE